jgi:hypothetical protein
VSGNRFDNKDGRVRGRKLQARRLNAWIANPHCAVCGKLVEFSARPSYGFELDHTQALKAGGGKGEDTEENSQVLCNGLDGCHRAKTAKDMGSREVRQIGADGWPVE